MSLVLWTGDYFILEEVTFEVGTEFQVVEGAILDDGGNNNYNAVVVPANFSGGVEVEQYEGVPEGDHNLIQLEVVTEDYGEGNNKDTSLSFAQFNSEMEQNVQDIVRESIALFERDPREYHPFYLIISKHLQIGQQLGYISQEEGEDLLSWWRKFDTYAREQWEIPKQTTVSLTSEKSPYATYMLTRKVYIDGGELEVKQKWNDKERLKIFRVLESQARKIKNSGDLVGAKDGNLEMRLEFFKECKGITYAGDVLKMNNLWTKLLSEEGFFTRKRKGDSGSGDILIPVEPASQETQMESSLPVVKECIDNAIKMQNKLVLMTKRRLKINALKRKAFREKLKKKIDFQRLNAKKLAKINQQRIKTREKLEKILCKNASLSLAKDIDKKKKCSKIPSAATGKPKQQKRKKTPPLSEQEVQTESAHHDQVNEDPSSTDMVCDECGQTFLEFRNLIAHKKRVHNPQPHIFKCPTCKLQFRAGRTLWVHFYRNHMSHEETSQDIQLLLKQQHPSTAKRSRGTPATPSHFSEPTTCEQCGKLFQTLAGLQRHQKKVHGECLSIENCIQCTHCPKEFKERFSMETHVRRFHLHTEVTTCDQCDKECGSIGLLWKHKVDIHGLSAKKAAKTIKGADIKYGKCTYCREMLLKGRQYSNHVRTQHPEEFKEWWKRELKRRKELSVQKKRDDRKRFREEGVGPQWLLKEGGCKLGNGRECPKCGKIVKSSLRRHLRLVHGVHEMEGEEWRCPKEGCASMFQNRSNLISHLMEIHCDLEQKIVDMRIIKFEERSRESGICKQKDVYICKICERELYHRAEVRVHIVAEHPEVYQSLQGQKPLPQQQLPCPHCGQVSIENDDMRLHLEEKHGDICWRCPDCQKVMLSPSDLSQHYVAEHDVEKEASGGSNENGGHDGGSCQNERQNGLRKKLNVEEVAERQKERNDVYAKYRKMRGNCEVCGDNLSLGRLGHHLKNMHGILELPWNCTICGKNGLRSRLNWLGHMEILHGNSVNVEEIVERARKVNALEETWKLAKQEVTTKRNSKKSKRKTEKLSSGVRRRKGKSTSQNQAESLEKDKRLVIKLVRLSHEEIWDIQQNQKNV